ncbi:hypothetical protein CJF43_16340 [Pseudomonas fragi]|uniref:Ribosomal protein S3AE n=1 Tax=Pseudomonas fragi TaxID=296 RepID=A0A266LSL8_PSEFR|nr:hypothetical protein [Pseudomonas fragi]OZY40660.1 hypothetical protein CJF43_16340 [Pseudomonas fragi]
MTPSVTLRSPCPPGACICEREQLLAAPASDLRIFNLTRQAEKVLLERLENIQSFDDLEHMRRRMREQLGIRVLIDPGVTEVRTMRGIAIHLAEQPGLCRKTRQAIPAAIRRALEKRPEIAWKLLDGHGLFRDP